MASGVPNSYLPAMCGRFALLTPPSDLAEAFATSGAPPNAAPTWNLPPSQPACVVRRDPKTGERRLDLLRWGLIPHFTRDPARLRMLNNARAETVAALPSFRGAFAARRCLVPADAFYEWRRDGARKQPFAVARLDGAPLAFAGLWESWTHPGNGEIVRSFAIVTTRANELMAPIHNRMPVVLEAEDWPVWLGERPGEPETLLRPAAQGVLRAWPVSAEVNNVRHDGPALLEPMSEMAAGGGPNPA